MDLKILANYTTYVISIATMRVSYSQLLPEIVQSYLIRMDELEDLFDWLIQESFTSLMQGSHYRLNTHYRHDVFRIVYDSHFKYMMPMFLRDRMRDINMSHPGSANCPYKLMVCGDVLFISKGM
jgi:hypothetical protein